MVIGNDFKTVFVNNQKLIKAKTWLTFPFKNEVIILGGNNKRIYKFNHEDNTIHETSIELKVREEFWNYKEIIEIENKIYMFGRTHIHILNCLDDTIEIIKNKGTYKT